MSDNVEILTRHPYNALTGLVALHSGIVDVS